MLYLEILKAKSELEGYIVNYFSKYFSSVVINEKKNQTTKQQQKTFNNLLGRKTLKFTAEKRGTLAWVVLQGIEGKFWVFLTKLDRQGDL